MTTLGIALALGCAAMANVGMLCKHRGACEAPEISLKAPLRSIGELFRSRWWTIGFAVAAVAWVLHVAAMAVAPLSLVQAVIAGGLVLIAYPATRYFGHSLNPREWLGLGLAAGGLAFLAVTVPHATENEGYSIATLAGFEAVTVGAGCALFASGILRRGSICHGVILGLSSGLLIGVSNVAIKALTEGVEIGGMVALASPWTVLAVIGGLGAFFALARGMQLGEAIPVIATASVASNCAAILGGVIVFGDPIGSGLVEGLLRGLAFPAVIAAAAVMPHVPTGPRPGAQTA
jgi:multidrug transporter EmrE-like cation transporter